ncbi:trypsin 3A1-like [Uranotaenia lowii]|uniref:trypsin 3A1-like n=1 Tax=Uranotaenia lowii TaxID=190385 RepID=UPI00247A8156|nr:trypsin 3A1-like [Uranotaenia lowii]
MIILGLIALVVSSPAEDFRRKSEMPGSGLIAGGVDADVADYPYQLSLRLDGEHFCGASVISDHWALSSAICTFRWQDEVERYALKGGSSNRLEGGVIFQVAQIEVHPEWNFMTYEYDVSALRTVENMIGGIIMAIPLDPAGTEHAHGSRAVLSGWGRVDPSNPNLPIILQRLDKPVLGQVECAAQFMGMIRDSMLCAGGESGRSACQGDQGSPLVTGGRQIGVYSFGEVMCIGHESGVYAKIAYPTIRSWITEVTGV